MTFVNIILVVVAIYALAFAALGAVAVFTVLVNAFVRFTDKLGAVMDKSDGVVKYLKDLCGYAALTGGAIAAIFGFAEGSVVYALFAVFVFVSFKACELAFFVELERREIRKKELETAALKRKALGAKRRFVKS